MKQIIFILFSILVLNTNIHAQTKAATQPTKVEVATPDLPDPIKNVITTKYHEWKLMSAHVYNAAPEYYELELKKGEENIVIKIDAKGNEL